MPLQKAERNSPKGKWNRNDALLQRMKSAIILFVAALVPMVLASCSNSPARTEIDCAGFSQALQRDEFSPPGEADTIDTDTAEKMLIRKVFPKYPDLAVRAGLEGAVWLKLWIGRDGIVRQVSIAKSDAEIFNEPSLEAGRKLVFKPASCRGRPVSMWATIPIRFKFRD